MGWTAQKAPPGKDAIVARNRASRKRERTANRLKSERGRGALVPRNAHVLGAPSRTRAAHIVQLRPVGVERPGEEGTPEGAEFGERLFHADRAGRPHSRSGNDRSHDAKPV